ncbi:MAG: hypothetical protein WC796_04815 [Candidatus Pacearchaeota archaeon]|jgi:hypothetical protein
MRPPLEILLPPELGMDLLYSFVIIICSLMIYYATREMYELSSYKGIKYFRQSFLFFAIAYFFRYSIMFFLTFFNLRSILDFSPRYIGWVSLFLFLFFSSMAVFYLVYSVMWKKWNHGKIVISLFAILSLVIALIGALFNSMLISLILNIVLLIFVLLTLLVAYKDSIGKKKGKSLFIIYLLLFVFWILNVIDILIPRFLQVYQILIYLASLLMFMIILYKVLRKAGD